MNNKNVILAILGGIAVAAAIICWLVFGGSVPKNVELGEGVKAKFNASLKNSVIQREKDGKKMWEFTIGEIINDKVTDTAILKGIKGKVYRSDGNYIDIDAESGSMKMGTNNFALEGNVKAINSDGGKLLADKVEWIQKGERIIATGNVKLYKDEWFASADKAMTTSAFDNLKLQGNAMVEKGGDNQ